MSDPSSLRDAQRVVTQLSQLETIHLVVNRVRPRLLRRQNTTIDDAMDTAGLPLLGLVPEDPKGGSGGHRRPSPGPVGGSARGLSGPMKTSPAGSPANRYP